MNIQESRGISFYLMMIARIARNRVSNLISLNFMHESRSYQVMKNNFNFFAVKSDGNASHFPPDAFTLEQRRRGAVLLHFIGKWIAHLWSGLKCGTSSIYAQLFLEEYPLPIILIPFSTAHSEWLLRKNVEVPKLFHHLGMLKFDQKTYNMPMFHL